MNGHRVPGCDGEWIAIGTLADPHRQLCARCRGTRRDPGELGEPDASPLATEEPQDGHSNLPLWRRLEWFLLGALVGALSVGLGIVTALALSPP